jgi:hypothetical protein
MRRTGPPEGGPSASTRAPAGARSLVVAPAGGQAVSLWPAPGVKRLRRRDTDIGWRG